MIYGMIATVEEVMKAHSLDWKRFPLIVLVAILAVLVPVSPKRAVAQTADEAVLAVEKHYQSLVDLTAKVTQINHLKAVGKTQTFEGKLLIKKPGRLRLEYTNGQLILIDGGSALIYMKKSEQMIKKAFTDFEHMNIPVAFLLGAAHIRNDFDVLQPDPKAPRQLELLPKKSNAAMKKLALESDDAGSIKKLTIFDSTGNVTEINFTTVREGVGLEDKQFTFKPPKGTEVIEQ